MFNVSQVKFENGKAVLRAGRKIVAKIYDRAVFYRVNNIKSGFSHPYSFEIAAGHRECDSIEECIEYINKYL